MKRKIIFYFSIVFINLFGFALIFFIYLMLINFNIISTPKFISKNKTYRKFHSTFFFSKKEKELIKIMDDNYYDFYPAVELGGDYEHLSKKLFDFPILSGQKTFVHKPNIEKLMTIFPIEENRKIKTINFSLPYDVKLKNLLNDLVINSTSYDNLKYFRLEVAHFDNNGFRKNNLVNTKNLPNILFLGDSYSEGLYVKDNETFVYNLGHLMDIANYGYPINAGCNGYGTVNEFLILKEYYARLKIKMVFLLHCFNDVINSQDIVFSGKSPDLKKAWDENFKLLNSINEFCRQNNIVFVIYAYCNLFQFINPEIESRKNYQEKLKVFCSQNNIAFIDLFDDIKKELKLDPVKCKKVKKDTILNDNDFYEQKFGENIFIPYDDHLSPYGHKIFAQALWQKIKELNLKPVL